MTGTLPGLDLPTFRVRRTPRNPDGTFRWCPPHRDYAQERWMAAQSRKPDAKTAPPPADPEHLAAPAPPIGHNGGPPIAPGPTRQESSLRIERDIARLREGARVAAIKRERPRNPEVFAAAMREQLALRQPQINRLMRKLDRLK